MTRFILATMLFVAPAFAQDAAWIQADIDGDLAAGRPAVVELPARDIFLEKPVRFHGNFPRLTGEPGTKVICRFPPELFNHPMFDFTGTTRAYIADIEIHGTERYLPRSAFLFARTVANESSGWHVMQRTYIRGHYSAACIANIASEGNLFEAELQNHQGATREINGVPHGGHLLLVANADPAWFGTPLGASTMLTLTVDGAGYLWSKSPIRDNAAPTSAVMMYLQGGGGHFTFRNINSSQQKQWSTFVVQLPRGGIGRTHNITIKDSRFEDNTNERFFTIVDSETGHRKGQRAVEFLSITNSFIRVRDKFIDVDGRAEMLTLSDLFLVRDAGRTDEPAVNLPSGKVDLRWRWYDPPHGWAKVTE